MKTLLSVLALAAIAFAFPATASAADHPGYLHALSDLRAARFFLQRHEPGPRDGYAISEIDAAINEIKTASIDDGKNLNDHPAPDPTWNDAGRFHHALEFLDRAHRDISENEDNVYAQGLQHRALEHIDKAHHLVKEIIDRW
jgi:hypothetical protein